MQYKWEKDTATIYLYINIYKRCRYYFLLFNSLIVEQFNHC